VTSVAATHSILNGSAFLVADERGNIAAQPNDPAGFFFEDTRFLSRWSLTLDDHPLDVLSADRLQYYSTRVFLFEPTGTIYRNPTASLMRTQFVGRVLHDEIVILNHADEPLHRTLRLEVDSDFADLFEVKDREPKRGTITRAVDGQALVLTYRRDDFVRGVHVRASSPAEVDSHGLTLSLEVPPHGRFEVHLEARPLTAEQPVERRARTRAARPAMGLDLEGWLDAAPRLVTDSDAIGHTYRRSLVDLAALRFYPGGASGGASLPAAGLPWFMALFGRDSVIASYQALPFQPGLAATTLRTLARFQARADDPFRDEEPGKILHELRVGELAHFRERPQSPYYGAADSTPLFLVLLDEYHRWSGDDSLVRALEPSARAALAWIDVHGDRDGDGFVEYERRNTGTGLENQCWKDSWNSMVWPDGRLVTAPRTVCEVQGYVFDAKRRCARLARDVWGDPELAEELEAQAAALRQRFHDRFWDERRQYVALALDGAKRAVPTATSNPGHLLWSGILFDEAAAAVARRLFEDDLFSGWGIRTMAASEGPYNPLEYHNGTVWPHDNSLIAAGLARYGYRREASRISAAMFEAAERFAYRLPEVFAGYARDLTEFPVEYPTACSPQAWAAGTPLLLLRVALGLEPVGDRLASDPVLPSGTRQLDLLGVPGPWGRADVRARG
jgi:glycogen debranching enzyme